MPKIGINLNDVPNVVPVVGTGIYDTRIESVELKPNKNQDGHNLIVEHKIITEGPEKDRKLTDYISLKMQTKIKRLFLSAGITTFGSEGTDTEDLIGKNAKIQVVQESYEDKDTHEQKLASRIREYIIPA